MSCFLKYALTALIPLLVSVALATYFQQKDAGYMIFVCFAVGILPVTAICGGNWNFWPKKTKENRFKLFRFVVSIVAYCMLYVNSVLVGLSAQLYYAYNYAWPSLLLFCYSMLCAVVARMATFQQRMAEKETVSIFSPRQPFTSRPVKHDDNLEFEEICPNIPFGVKEELEKNRTLVKSQSQGCVALSIVFCCIGLWLYFGHMPARFEMYNRHGIAPWCINQTLVNRYTQGEVIAIAKCMYPLCTVPPVSRGATDRPITGLDNATVLIFQGDVLYKSKDNVSLSDDCQTYQLLQYCNGLGYVGVMGTIQVGNNCTCPETALNTQKDVICEKKSDVPQSFDYSPLLVIAILLFQYQSDILNRVNSMKWNMLKIYALSTREPVCEL